VPEKINVAKAVFLLVLLASIIFSSSPIEVIGTDKVNINHVSSHDSDITITYTSSSFTIESTSQRGNFSFTFSWRYEGTNVIYNDTPTPIRYLEKIIFMDKTAKYRMDYFVPVMLYEYIDADGNGILNDTEQITPDIFVASYVINTNMKMTNVTLGEDANGIPVCEWTYTQLAMPRTSNVHEPWERLPTVKEKFHYYPLNGTLKMDIILQNYRNPANEYFKSENTSTRFFLGYGVRYASLEPGNATVTVAFDRQELVYDQINRVHPTTSTIIVFKVNGIKKGFFDFGGEVTIDGNSGRQVNGSAGPTRSWYYYQTDGLWLEIGLNYPHVNQTLIHDPYFGLYLRSPIAIAITFPFEWTVATAVVSVIICTVAIVDYFKTKKRYLKSAMRPLT
jgi:hypothetical protein